MSSLSSIIAIAASGLRAQSVRLRVVSENIANANSTAQTSNEDPYRRKVVTFGQVSLPGESASLVSVTDITAAQGEFRLSFDPGHPAADVNGFIKLPNVNSIIEMSNMREAARSYEANMNMLESAQKMRNELIDLLK
jgi:flagellar basal-body rod protein FlgC